MKQDKRIVLPLKSEIGANELKKSMAKNTLKGFTFTVITFAFILLMTLFNLFPDDITKELINIYLSEVTEIAFDLPPKKIGDESKKKKVKLVHVKRRNFGTEEVHSEVIRKVNDIIADSLPEFSNFDSLEFAMSTPGVTTETSPFENAIELKRNATLTVETIEAKPVEKTPVLEFAEELPKIDINELNKKIEYPRMAIELKIEGGVVVKALISENGQAIKTVVLHSDSKMLEKAAINAVSNSIFTPALQNGAAVKCWLNVPIRFKLR